MSWVEHSTFWEIATKILGQKYVVKTKVSSLPPTNFRLRYNTEEVAESGHESELAIAPFICAVEPWFLQLKFYLS